STITFSELSSRPVDGVVLNGVTFAFSIGGVPSTDATFGGGGPGTTLYTTPPQLEGNTAGLLTLTFASPTPTFSMPIVLAVGGAVANAATIQLFDAANNLISSNIVNTVVPPGFGFSEALFTYGGGTPIKVAN